MTPVRLGDLADRFELEIKGQPDHRITRLATLERAGDDALSFLANPSYLPQLEQTGAGAVVIADAHADRFEGNRLISADPYLSWARIADYLNPPPIASPGIDPSASVAGSCDIDPSASIGPQVSLGEACRIGARAVIGPGCVIEKGAEIGDDCRLVARVFIGAGCRVGARTLIHPGVVIGADGFGLAFDRDHWIKVPQLGSVVIGPDCEIGANSTIDRGAIDDTVLEEDVRLDNQVQIAHNVHIGAHTAIAGCVGIAGSTRVGRYCMIAGASGIGGHLTIADRVVITAMSTVLESIHEPGQYGSGIPARPQRQWQRMLVRLTQLEAWARRLARIEKETGH
jgi:UDP-3-O-[3-hydroxymyristoyl] glucosamine N-acyltransferase